MNKLEKFIFGIFIKDLDKRIESQKNTISMIKSATSGNTSHFYNTQGVKIRGWAKKEYKFDKVHPLIAKYNK